MNDSAIIKGVYADYRRVKGRKVLQIIVEVPMEAAPLVHKAFGEPTPDGSTWVAVALLNNEKAKEKPDHKLSQQAAMCCNEGAFATFLMQQFGKFWNSSSSSMEGEPIPTICARVVRNICGVKSRSELDTDPAAAARWRDLHAEYKAWLLT